MRASLSPRELVKSSHFWKDTQSQLAGAHTPRLLGAVCDLDKHVSPGSACPPWGQEPEVSPAVLSPGSGAEGETKGREGMSAEGRLPVWAGQFS